MLCPNVRECGTVGHDWCYCYGVCKLRRRNRLFYFGKLPEQCDVRNEACWGVLGPHVVVRVLSDVFRGEEYLILCGTLCLWSVCVDVWTRVLGDSNSCCWGEYARSPEPLPVWPWVGPLSWALARVAEQAHSPEPLRCGRAGPSLEPLRVWPSRPTLLRKSKQLSSNAFYVMFWIVRCAGILCKK